MDIFYQKKTTKNFADAGEALKASLANHRFGVLWEMNFKDKLKEKGLELAQNFKVFEACNPAQRQKSPGNPSGSRLFPALQAGCF